MSYSFSVSGASLDDLLEKAEQYFNDNVLPGQAIHEKDKDTAFLAWKNAAKLIVANDDPDKELGMSVNGSVYTTNGEITGVSINVSVALIGKQPA